MDLEEAGRKFGEVNWNSEHTAFTARCPNGDHDLKVTLLAGAAFARCPSGCDAKGLKAWLANGKANNGPVEEPPLKTDPALWKLRVYKVIAQVLVADSEKGKGMLESMAEADLVESAIADAMKGVAAGLFNPLPALSEAEIGEEVESACRGAVRDFLAPRRVVPAVHVNGNGKVVPYVIPFEGYDTALVANAEYLKRQPVVEGLSYSSAVSMITGGKHAGKSTLARWLAICVAKNLPFLGRAVQQGRVLYLASEDETMVARQELLRLGWCAADPLQFLSMSNVTEEQVKFLESLTNYIGQNSVKLVVMDMLFDFARITDEMSYAQTREAVGAIQKVATRGNCHICTVHHAPKNAHIGDAAVAALGSQGIAARVSPLILVRRFGPGVHSISSTEVRDPRGKGFPDSRLLRNEDSSLTLGGAFKTYMLAEVYMPRLLELLEGEPDAEFTIAELAEALGPETGYHVTRQCLASMFRHGLVERRGAGKKGQPFRYCMKQINSTEDSGKETSLGYVSNLETPTAEQKGMFGYKD